MGAIIVVVVARGQALNKDEMGLRTLIGIVGLEHWHRHGHSLVG